MTRRSTPGLALALALTALTAPAAAQLPRQDSAPGDWVTLLPECALEGEARRPGPLRLLYPRPGLPAVVRAGTALVARMRMPSALTPPPGHQQEKALRGYDAALTASGALEAGGARVRYRLRVADVRPDAGSSVVYRVRLPIPAWVAPGTYSLELRAPSSGTAVSVASVRVLGEGQARIVALPALASASVDGLRARLARLEGYPADVLVTPASPQLLAALRAPRGRARWPAILVTGEGVAGLLRVGGRLVSVGDCGTRRYRRQLRAHATDGAVTELSAVVERDEALARWVAEAASPPALVVSPDRSWARAGGWLPRPAELRAVVPEDGRATRLDGAAGARFWPGVDLVATAAPPTLVATVELPPSARVTLSRAAANPRTLPLTATPASPHTDESVTLRADAPADASVFWLLAEDMTATGPEARHRWPVRDTVEVHALAIDGSGVPSRGSLAIAVDTQRVGVCSVHRARGGAPDGFALGSLAIVLWTIHRRRRRMRRPAKSTDGE